MTSSEIIINATNIGRQPDGIGVYTLSLLKALVRLDTPIRFTVLLNRNAEQHIRQITFPWNFSIKWTTRHVSPDYGFRGHLLRLIYSNLISLMYRKPLIFNTSQLEAIFFRSAQVITVHDAIPLLFRESHKKQYFFYKYLLKYALNKARRIITPSGHIQENLAAIYGLPQDKIRIIHNGIHDVYCKGTEQNSDVKKEKFILYAGRIAPSKNIDGLLKAFKLIRDKIEHQLVIAGGGKSLYVENHDRVTFKGYVSDTELQHLYKTASLFVFPSFCEGFGLPPLEAMACGCPVVVSNVASLPDVCGDATYYIDPYRTESIAEGMYKVLTDESLRQSLIKKGLERAKKFSWEKSAKELLKVFEEVLPS